MKKHLLVPLLFILISTASLFSLEPGPPIRTGHPGSLEAMAYAEDPSILITGGADGTIRGWDRLSGNPVFRIQVSHLPVKMVALHPSLPRVACLETDGIGTFIVSVWDYTTRRRVSLHRLEEMPLFLSYSSAGSYLVYGKTAWNSLVFLDGKTGRRVPGLEEAFGIVSSVFFSSSEKTLLAYGPSGSIQYWDMETGRRKTRFSTEEDLNNISFSSNGRYLLGHKDNRVYLVDLLSGKVLDTTGEAETTITAFDDSRDILYMISRDGAEITLQRYDIASGNLERTLETRFFLAEGISFAAAGYPALYLGTVNGDVYIFNENREGVSLLVGNNLTDITDLDIGEGYLAFTGEGRTILLPRNSGKAEPRVFEHPFKGAAGITRDDDGLFYVWQKHTAGVIHTLDPASGFISSLEAADVPIHEVSVLDTGRLLVLDRNNTLSLIDPVTGAREFTYSSFGVRVVEPVADGLLMAGRNKTSDLSAPLLVIHPDTGETVPINGDNIVTLDLRYNPERRDLYSLGMEERFGSLKTVLKVHSGPSWERSRTLLAFSGEDQSATFALDEDDSTVFTSLGYGHVRMYRWGGFTSLQRAARIPEKLVAGGGYLMALNTDNTVTLWNTDSGRILRELYFFTNGSYASVEADGNISASPEAESFLADTP